MCLTLGWCAARFVLVVLGGLGMAELIRDEEEAWAWAHSNDQCAQEVYLDNTAAIWNYHGNMTAETQRHTAKAQQAYTQYWRDSAQNASQFDWQNFRNDTLRRLFAKLAVFGLSVLSPQQIQELGYIGLKLKEIYGTGQVCRDSGECLLLDPGLTRLFHASRDWHELQWAWQGWRDNTGKRMRDVYRRQIELQNEAAVLNGFRNMGANWKSSYEVDDFEALVKLLWKEVEPLYSELHAYTRRKLQQHYADKPFPETGHIPAHILGDMWSQQWANIMDIVRPYPNSVPINITKALIQQGYDVKRLFRLSEDFYTSLGFPPLPDSFWNHSILERPHDGRDMMCHPSSWDFYNGKDFRIMQCTDVSEEFLLVTHHEMGHVYYFMEYRDQPVHFRDGPNAGFHEAIGDLMTLSVSVPEHLHKVGILQDLDETPEMEIESLLARALNKIPAMPYTMILDMWRWSVYEGNTTSGDYNRYWWDLRCKYQGMSPPVSRSENDFDPGAKFHLAADIPSIRYFISSILEFQFQEGLCRLANHTGPLHKCDIYGSLEAGTKLRNMLRLGRSVTWPDALEIVTGTRNMSARALREYFRPLEEWLRNENRNHSVGWNEQCPPWTFSGATILKTELSIILTNSACTIVICLKIFYSIFL